MNDHRCVWIVCSNRWNSAITEFALSTARALTLQGWKVFYSPLAGSPGAARAARYQLPGRAFSSFGPSEVFQFLTEARRIKPDLIILFGGPETVLSRLLPGIAKLRFRGQDIDLSAPLPRRKHRWNMNHCRAVITPSRQLQQRFAEIMSAPVKDITLGIDSSLYQWRPEVWGQSERPTIKIVGRFDPVKGHGHFFSIFHQLLKVWPGDRPQPLLEVIGEPANVSVDQLRAAAQSADLIEGQHWLLRAERVHTIAEAMSSAHLGVISSLGSEVICRVAEEFLLCGCPIFVSGVGSLEECLVDPAFGQSYRDLTSDQTVQALAALLWSSFQETRETRQRRAELARAYFSLETMGQHLARFFQSLTQSAVKERLS